jgi:Glycoside-hydrolase family GH114
MMRRRTIPVALAGLALALGSAAGVDGAGAAAPDRATPAAGVVLPTPDVDWDYQIGGAFAPAAGVTLVSRDRNDAPLPGAYNVCYVNAFQTQADEKAFWVDHPAHWSLVLKDAAGHPVVDGRWGEFLLDTRTADKRTRLARIVGRWIAGCATDGFDGVELDNLDSWDRARGLVSKADDKAFARLLTGRAHDAGLAAAQKNWAELSSRGPALGFDFAVAEECGRYDECDAYAAAYDDRVYVVEYRDQDFATACQRWGDSLSIVRRDVEVTPGGVDRRC